MGLWGGWSMKKKVLEYFNIFIKERIKRVMSRPDRHKIKNQQLLWILHHRQLSMEFTNFLK